MADEVEIVNVGGDGKVASEETLQALLKAMEKMAKAKGADPKKVIKDTKELSEKTKDLIKVVRDNTDALEENTDAVEDHSRALNLASRMFSSLTYAIGASLSSLGSFANEVMFGGTQLQSFTRHIPIIGGLLDGLSSFLDDSVSSFRELSSVGAAFGNSITDMRLTAARMELSLSEMTGFITSNSEALRILGGSVTEGVKRFADLNRGLKDNGTFRSLRELGFSIQEMNEGMLSYVQLQSRLGRLERMDNASLQQGTAAYLEDLDELAKLTGKQRDQLAAELADQATDAGIRALMNQFAEGSQELRNFRTNLTLIDEIGGSAGAAMRDLLDGMPSSAETAQFVGMLGDAGPAVADAMAQIGQGADPQVLLDAFKSAGGELEKYSGLEGTERAQFIANLRRSNPAMAEFLDVATRMTQAGSRDLDAVSAEQDRRDEITQQLTNFEDAIRRARSQIVEQFLSSGLFKKVAAGMTMLADTISGPVAGSISSAITSIISFIDQFLLDVQNKGLWNAIKDIFADGFKTIIEEAKLYIFGGTRDNTQAIGRTDARINELQDRRSSLEAQDRHGADVLDEMRLVDDMISQLQAERNNLVQTQGEQIEGIMSGFTQSIFGMSDTARTQMENDRMSMEAELSALEARRQGGHGGIFTEEDVARADELRASIAAMDDELSQTSMFDGMFESLSGVSGLLLGAGGGVGLAALFVALGASLTGVSLPALALGAAIGMGAGGLGYMFNGLSNVIKETSDGITNVLDSINRFRTEGIYATTDQVERLSRIPSDNLTSAASGLTAMKEALDGFSPGVLSTLTSWATGGADIEQTNILTAQITSLADAFGRLDPEQINNASTAVTNMGNSLVSFAQGLAANTGAGILESIRGWFGGDDDITEKITNMATSFGSINGNNLVSASRGIASIGTSLVSSATGINALSNANLDNLRRLANINITDAATGLREFSEIRGLQSQFSVINDSVADFENINQYADALENLVDVLKDLNEELSKDNNGWELGNGVNAGDVLGQISTSTQGSQESMNQLNTNIVQMITLLRQSLEVENRIERNTSSMGGNTARGRVSIPR